jgi:hypothetical protein
MDNATVETLTIGYCLLAAFVLVAGFITLWVQRR